MINSGRVLRSRYFSSKAMLLSLLSTLMLAQATDVQASNTEAELATALVSMDLLSREFRIDGAVEAINKATVSAQTSGAIQKILVDVDDFVEKGTVIVLLKDVSQKAQLKKAQAGEQEAISNLSKAQDEFERIEDIYAKKVVSKSQMDDATHALSAAKARLDSARASLEEAREQLSYTRVKAPYSGIVTERHVEVGETVQTGAKIMTGVSLDKLRVNVDVPQKLINKIRVYGKAFVYTEAGLGGDQVQVAVDKITIFPIADRASNTFKVRLDLPEGIAGLFPGMFVKASLVTGEKQVLQVPQQSIVYRSELTAVYVISDDGTINFRHVRLGRKNGDSLIVLSGLTEGEKVALDPIQAGIVLMQQRRQQNTAGTSHE
ncbi:MAG: efflux RND transporter periplasmic adaptor subunit [Gammaproteobacteria bacterium]|jgi:RND family efflux transporter MFP subunit|nr:efflux RND transporter periplasmic adaptor subunit [Gammaproteobacteria bacterium]